MNEKYYSHCCGVYMPDYPDSDFCPTCHEHCCGINREEMEAVMANSIKIELLNEEKRYKLSLGNYAIIATVRDNQVYLQTNNEVNSFTFHNSPPETLEVIGLLIIEAGKLLKGEKR